MIRTYPEMQQVMRRIEAIVHKYIPDAEVRFVSSDKTFASTDLPPLRNKNERKVIIEFNLTLIETATWEEIENVVAHEIAHALAADRYDRTAADIDWHTDEWKDITRALGGSGTIDIYQDVLYPQRYKYRCANCGYTTNVSEPRFKMPKTLQGVAEHGIATGHHKWYVLDEVTGRRWTETL
jgi:predicted SprT family Zn-dependent metalloprotease